MAKKWRNPQKSDMSVYPIDQVDQNPREAWKPQQFRPAQHLQQPTGRSGGVPRPFSVALRLAAPPHRASGDDSEQRGLIFECGQGCVSFPGLVGDPGRHGSSRARLPTYPQATCPGPTEDTYLPTYLRACLPRGYAATSTRGDTPRGSPWCHDFWSGMNGCCV